MKTENTKYNGWTNYATWRVNLEIFDGLQSDMDNEQFSAESCKDYAEEIVLGGDINPQDIAASYALAFMSDVNWYEIAEALNEK